MKHRHHTTNKEEARAFRALMVQVRNTALHHFERVDLRTLRALQSLDLQKDKDMAIGADVDLDVLRNAKHERRQAMREGPLVIYRAEGDKHKRIVVEPAVLMYSDRQDVRKASVDCISQMLDNNKSLLTPRSVAILNKFRNDLMSGEQKKWQKAAIAVCDALYDDALFALHGTRQSLECEPVLQDHLNTYTEKILHPSVASLESITLPCGNPERDQQQLKQVLSDVVASATGLVDLCNRYLDACGFLPLAQPYTMSDAVEKWLGSNTVAHAWNDIWAWADDFSTPLARYHACTVFILQPELIPDKKIQDLWSELIAIVKDSNRKGEDTMAYEPWTIRRDLARHFVYHLEARLPEQDGAAIACMAWWFAEQVAGLFPNKPDVAKFYRENWVEPVLNRSVHTWLVANSSIRSSVLRHITLNIPSPWAVSLLAIMAECLDDLDPGNQPDETKRTFYSALITNFVTCLPFSQEGKSGTVFAPEHALTGTVLKWAEYQDEESKKASQQLASIGIRLSTDDGLCEALRNLKKVEIPDQISICLALKSAAYTHPSIAESIMEIVSVREWRTEILAEIDIQVQGLLIESLSRFLVDNQGQCLSELPHYLAELCEKESDKDRKRNLFLYVLHTSLVTDSVSAVKRLLRGDHKDQFVELAEEYRAMTEMMRPNYPPWVASRMRGLMASMHIL